MPLELESWTVNSHHRGAESGTQVVRTLQTLQPSQHLFSSSLSFVSGWTLLSTRIFLEDLMSSPPHLLALLIAPPLFLLWALDGGAVVDVSMHSMAELPVSEMVTLGLPLKQ